MVEIARRGGLAGGGAILPEPIGREAPHLIGEAREIEGSKFERPGYESQEFGDREFEGHELESQEY